MRAATRPMIKCAPSEAQNRLARARLALKLAEERTGLRGSAGLEVQRAISSAPISTPTDSSQAASLMALAASQDSGALSLQGSTTLLLALLALRQGATGWCAVVGGEGLGWCAATEVGLDLDRLLTVPASSLDDASALTVVSILLDGVDALLVGSSIAARLRPQRRRRLLARARERGHLILTSAPWEGARTLRADSLPSGTGTADASLSRPQVEPSVKSAADGVVTPIGRRISRSPGQGAEMPAGYLRRLTWTLTDPQRPQIAATDVLTLSLSAEGLQAGSRDAVQPAPKPQEAIG